MGSVDSQPQPQSQMGRDAAAFVPLCEGKVVYCSFPQPAQKLSAAFEWSVSCPQRGTGGAEGKDQAVIVCCKCVCVEPG